MKNLVRPDLKLRLFCIGIYFLSACSSQKDTAMNRGLQNLGARYNYIYNSNVILNNYEEELYQNYADNYNEVLPLYTAPEKFSASVANPAPVNEKALDAIILKARAVIAEKTLSNYIDESYLLLGKAFYFKANYFIAQEYFDYAAKTYPDKPDIYLSALNWKARSMMQLNNLKDAALVLDTVYHNLTLARVNTAEPMATITQMFIYQDKIDEAVPLLEKAIKETNLKRNRIRWTYILAQLYEMQKKYPEALQNYTRVQKSNAAFELYFNANLNSIKLNGLLKGKQPDRKKQLLALLRDDKNLDYTDQVYFQVAQGYADEGNYTEAERYDQLSVRSSYKNKYQKGLSYLNIADLNFKNLRNFLKAKSYYDSAINTLPKNYSGYEQIVKKTRNLEYLTRRYEIIAMEDTLQMLAALPENERAVRIKSILKPAAPPVADTRNIGNQSLSNPNPFPAAANSNTTPETTGSFYFANSTAVSRGYSDFLIRWGNRKLEDNWRQSVKSSAQTTAESIAKVEDGPLPREGNINSDTSKTAIADQYLKAVPVSPALLAASDQKIIDAYYDIASFYQQELNDQQEALRIYQLILSRFPENNRLAAIYYSMYLGYKNDDPANAEKYKTLVLTKFPSGNYAKTILDPDFSVKQSAAQAAVIQRYNTVFDQYERKAFPQVITAVSAITSAYPENEFSPQLSYLQAIAIGRTQPVDSLIGAFKMISKNYPGDKLIVPLVNDHLAYLAAHMDDFKNRKIALPDFDASEPRFFAVAEKTRPVQQTEPAATIKPGEVKLPETIKTQEAAVTANSLFSTALSQVYYYVIDVADATLTLSSSRFGIGQFNRGNYADSDLRHRLSEFDNDQLIYVGNFSSFAEVKSYADGINPQLKQIMKVPAGLYNSFIISKENFEKLQSKDLVNKYLEFYKNNYEK